MEIRYETILEIYKERLSYKENECIMWQAQAKEMEYKIQELEQKLIDLNGKGKKSNE